MEVVLRRLNLLGLLIGIHKLKDSRWFLSLLQLLLLRIGFHIVFVFVLLLGRGLLAYCDSGHIFELGRIGRR